MYRYYWDYDVKKDISVIPFKNLLTDRAFLMYECGLCKWCSMYYTNYSLDQPLCVEEGANFMHPQSAIFSYLLKDNSLDAIEHGAASGYLKLLNDMQFLVVDVRHLKFGEGECMLFHQKMFYLMSNSLIEIFYFWLCKKGHCSSVLWFFSSETLSKNEAF